MARVAAVVALVLVAVLPTALLLGLTSLSAAVAIAGGVLMSLVLGVVVVAVILASTHRWRTPMM